jgi:hypothetical protein
VKKPATPAAAATGNQAKDVKKPATPAAAATGKPAASTPQAQMTPAKGTGTGVTAKPAPGKPVVAEAPAIEEEPVDEPGGASQPKKGKSASGKKEEDEFDEW